MMHRMNLRVEAGPGCWSRLFLRARLAKSCTRDVKAQALRAACLDMAAEQRADGIARGVTVCDHAGCARPASHLWVRTPAQIKASTRKVKGQALRLEPQSIVCAVHVPAWRVAVYLPLVEDAAELAA